MSKIFQKISLILAVFIILSINLQSEYARPYRFGLKLGSPNLGGFGLEYILPVMDNKLGANFDISYIPAISLKALVPENEYGATADPAISLLYWNLSCNYYFFGSGKGLYAGLGFGRFSANIDVKSINSESFPVTYQGHDGFLNIMDGNANISFGINIMPLKVGYKFVAGAFTTGLEIGYGLAFYDNAVKITGDAIVAGKSDEFPDVEPMQKVNFNDYMKEYNVKEEIPDGISSGFPIFAWTIGLAF
jgi:hypothetical protein